MADATRRPAPAGEHDAELGNDALPTADTLRVTARLEAELRRMEPGSGQALALCDALATIRTLRDDADSVRQRYVGLINAVPDAVTLLDLDGNVLEANEAACRIYGRSHQALTRLNIRDLNPDLSPGRMDEVNRTYRVGDVFTVEAENSRGDGTRFPVEVHSAVFLDRGERRVLAVARDITQRRAAEAELRASERRYRQLLQAMDKGIMVQDGRGRVVSVNPAACRILGADEAALLDPEDRFERWNAVDEHGRGIGLEDMPGMRALRERRAVGSTLLGIYNRQRHQHAWLSVTAVPFFHEDGQGAPLQVISTFSDVTELRRQARTDALTGLTNRDAGMAALEAAIEAASAQGAARGAGPVALYVDLDRFKVINDLLGHAAGDSVLAAAAQRLAATVGGDGIVARVGGDEFLVILSDRTGADRASALARRVCDAFGQPFRFAGEDFGVTASVGIAWYPQHGGSAQQLLQSADAAVADAKRRGRNTWQSFNPALAQQLSDRLVVETQLRRALENDEFRLVYQPQVVLDGGRMVAAEALIRWRNRMLGEMRPDRFIGHAETSGDIVRIGAWVIRSACRQMRAWRDAGLPLRRVAVNVSFRQFLSEDLVEIVVAALRESGLPGDALELEITERVLIEDAPDTMRTFAELKRLGVMLTIDDFGEGYSALNYLRRLPIDAVKISHAFMQGVPRNPSDVAICQAIVGIAHSLGLTVIAEGIEREEQRSFLTGLGVRLGQGFLFSAARPPDELAQFAR
jgi:diguanylate cyclase (GGDEF)-like protein/PAS domain S-box-containing protein